MGKSRVARDGDNDSMLAGGAKHLAAAETGFALHVLAAIDAGEFEVGLCFHSFLLFGLCEVMRNSSRESIKRF